jgi:hypothetical protein
MAPSTTGRRHHTRSAGSSSAVSSPVSVSPQTSPCSSRSGLGRVNRLTATVTTASTTKAATAPQKSADSGEPRSRGPRECRKWMATAARVPAASPQNPAQGVARRQNMAMMKVANSGALKNENSAWM